MGVVQDKGDDDINISVVKKTLNSLCMDVSRHQISSRIQSMVLLINHAVAEAYLFANFHITRCLDDGDFDVKQLPHLDRNFYYRCLLAVSTSNVRKDTLGQSFNDTMVAFDALRPAGYVKVDVRPWGQVIADVSIQMATMACNSVWANVDRVVIKYLRLKHPSLKKHFKKIVKAVVQYPESKIDTIIPEGLVHAIHIKEVVSHLRALFPLPRGKQFNTRAHLTMRLFHHVLTELGEVGRVDPKDKKTRKSHPRLFSILPRKNGFTISYVPISSMTFMKLLSMGDSPLESVSGDGRYENHTMLWRKYFNVQGLETKRSRFDNRILSDGKGVSVQMKQKGKEEVVEEGENAGYPKDANIVECKDAVGALRVGVDPGMTDIVTVASSAGRIESFSSARFSEVAGYNTSKRRTYKWNDETQDLVKSIPSPNTSNMVDLQDHVRAYLKALPILLQHRANKGYRSMRFFRYVGKQKTIEKVCDVIAPRAQTTVVGFGNWSNQGYGISRSCSGPIKEIRRCLSRRKNVLFKNVDERNTSCKCHGCFQRLVNMKADSVVWRGVCKESPIDGSITVEKQKMVVKNVKVHKVLHCRDSVKSASSNVRCGATWNRDVNAAKNLLLLLTTWMDGRERPEAFCVPSPPPKTTVSIEASVSAKPTDPPGFVSSLPCYPLGQLKC